jgi:hypothetical protein
LELIVDGDAFGGRILKDGFGTDLAGWFEEGLGCASLRDGRMLVDALEGGYTAFWKEELPADLLVSYVCRTLPPQGQNNINLVSHCRGEVHGKWPIVELGRYKLYQKLPNYIVTFVGDYNEETGARDSHGRTRLRRNPGFQLLGEKFEVPSNLEQSYQITYAVRGGRLRYYLDGRKIFDWRDPEPLPGGYFGLRTYKTREEYSDFMILALDRS